MKAINLTNYTDRTDVNGFISLFDQGAIRNPKTNETLFPKRSYDGELICPEEDENFDISNNNVISMDITFEEVKEALEEIDKGYFSFIGSDRDKDIKNLSNDYLTNHIQTINMYNGYFSN